MGLTETVINSLPVKWKYIGLALVVGGTVGYGLHSRVIAQRERERLARCEAELKPRHQVEIVFHKYKLDGQIYGGDGESMVGTVHFTVIVDGAAKGEYLSRVRLLAGQRYDAPSLLVEPPLGYSGPFNQQAFSEDAGRYIRNIIHTCDTPADRIARSTVAAMVNVTAEREWMTSFRADPQPEPL